MTASSGKSQGSDWGFWVVLLGLSVRVFTHWITPVHEWMHGIVVVLLGGRITGMEQVKIWFIMPDPGLNSIVIVSAFWMEMILYWSIGMIFHRRFVGKAAAGIMTALPVYGLLSTDFDRVRDIFPANELLYALIGGLMVIGLLYRHLPDSETVDTQKVKSTVRSVKS